jgi:hypothetical protein
MFKCLSMLLHAKNQRPSQEQRSDAARERLIRAAIDRIADKSYAGTATAGINERAGVSNGARVHHFKPDWTLSSQQPHTPTRRRRPIRCGRPTRLSRNLNRCQRSCTKPITSVRGRAILSSMN